MGEVTTLRMYIYCDSPACEFLVMGPVEGQPRLGIFNGTTQREARSSAKMQGWAIAKSLIVVEGCYPPWSCPECVQKSKESRE